MELLCLKALWSLREANVEAVRQALSGHKPLAYTTVLTLLDRLARRGSVSRRKEARTFLYQPQVSADALRRLALNEFLDRYFNGSEDDLVTFLRREPAPEEIGPAAERAEQRLDPALL
ncbi:MAG: BlaI/MecI/CopY family transcriptional regulator [Acidobacteriota bacterium]|nr:BlaI/MecI/CopY family transcriptional regulator [Acidobacteriota bacterium]